MGIVTPNVPIMARLSDYALTRLFIACNRYVDFVATEAPRHPKHVDLWARRTQDAQTALTNVSNEIVRREQGERPKRRKRPAKAA